MSAEVSDVRANVLCSNCNQKKPETFRPHCPEKTCPWWKCRRCGADNDNRGNNSLTTIAGTSKTGRTYG